MSDVPEQAPVTPAVEEPVVDGVAAQEDQEWNDEISDFASQNDYKVEEPKVEEPESGEKPELNEDGTPKSDNPDAAPGTEEKPTGEPNAADPNADPAKNPKPDEPGEQAPTAVPTVRDQRTAQREMEAQERELKSDIRTKLFADVQTELTDKDGDPIRTIEDVQKLRNPNTAKPFTAEEAGLFLLQSQQRIETENKRVEQEVDKIAEVNMTLGDKADKLVERYAELFKARPDVQKRVGEAFNKTLVIDPETGIIRDMPTDIEDFYEAALGGYEEKMQADAAAATAAAEAATKAAADKAEADAKEAAEKQKKDKALQHNDRADILSNGADNTGMDADAKEWNEAAQELYN